MKVKLVIPDHAPGLIDPVTKRSPFIDPDTKRVLETADVPESNHWIRRLLEVPPSIVRISETAPPVGNEPIKPLTTREGK